MEENIETLDIFLSSIKTNKPRKYCSLKPEEIPIDYRSRNLPPECQVAS
jgi:hypothetical protein